MRKSLQDSTTQDIITHGCCARLLNLLSQDLNVKNVTEHVMSIIKYFRNNHFASFWTHFTTGNKMKNTFRFSGGFVKNWTILVKIYGEHKTKFDATVRQKVTNIGVKRSAEDMLSIWKPIAVALNRVQQNSCTLSQSVQIWKQLENRSYCSPSG
ncbi:hypothetical protein PR048_024900 [Dryococelus australis]|uniref:Uncharacterized protein n=1 Tax=Dryococelus australis TaxID=614101 RepID=A0ABQ9GPU3_9NEOP|nr:hypothetical protein PR048_024900 [Dryococelus australis]